MTKHKPVTIRTLGDVLASPRYALWANCDRCSRGVKLNPQKLAATCGPDLAIADLKRRLKCSQCGRHTYSLTLGFNLQLPTVARGNANGQTTATAEQGHSEPPARRTGSRAETKNGSPAT